MKRAWQQSAARWGMLATVLAALISGGAISFAATSSSSSSSQSSWSMAVSYLNPETYQITSSGLTSTAAVNTTTTGPRIVFSPDVVITVLAPSTLGSFTTYTVTGAAPLPTALSTNGGSVQMIPDANGPAATLSTILSGQGFLPGTPISLATGTVATTPILTGNSVDDGVSVWQVGLNLPTTTALPSASESGSIALEAVANVS